MERNKKKKKHSLVDENSRIVISTSLIKDLFNKGNEKTHCPLKLYVTKIAKTHEEQPSINMLRGIFFEQQCIGQSSSHVSEDINFRSLFQKRNEDTPMAETQRILEQADYFKYELLEQYGMNLDNIQCVGTKDIGDDITLRGEADMLSPIRYSDLDGVEETFDMACIDLKLTGDIETAFGQFAWARPHEMDHTQAYVYNEIFNMPFFYFVFDYTVMKRFKPIRKSIDEVEKMEVMETIRKVAEVINKYEQQGYPARPNYWICKNCPINDTCDGYMSKPQIMNI